MPPSSPSLPSVLTVTAKVQLAVLSPWKRCVISFNFREGTLHVDNQVIPLRGSDVSHSRKGTSIVTHSFSTFSSRSHLNHTSDNNNNSSHNASSSLLSPQSQSHSHIGSSARSQVVTLTPCTPTSRAAWKKFSVGLTLASRSPEGFRLLRELGSGASGVVYKAYISDTELRSRLQSDANININNNTSAIDAGLVALKMIPKAHIDDCNAEYNMAKLSIAKHKSLLVPLHIFLTKTHLVIVMPLIMGGSLLERMQGVNNSNNNSNNLSEKLIRKIIHDVLSAVKVLHSKDLAHRDIKLENILVEHHNAYLCDLGLVAKVPKHGFIQSAGTKYIQAPEIGGITRYGKQCDIWSIGVVLIILLRKGIPFSDDNHRNHLLKQMRNSHDILDPLLSEKRRKNLPHTLLDLLRGLLCIDPVKRLTVAEALNHAYFTNIENEWVGEAEKKQKKNINNNNNAKADRESVHFGALGKISFVTLAIVRLRFMRAINRMRRISNVSSRASISIEAPPDNDNNNINGISNNYHYYNVNGNGNGNSNSGWRDNKRKCILQSALKLISSLCGSPCIEEDHQSTRRTRTPLASSFLGDSTSSGPPSPTSRRSNTPSPTSRRSLSNSNNPRNGHGHGHRNSPELASHRRWSLNLSR